jgi:hypothetical protein
MLALELTDDVKAFGDLFIVPPMPLATSLCPVPATGSLNGRVRDSIMPLMVMRHVLSGRLEFEVIGLVVAPVVVLVMDMMPMRNRAIRSFPGSHMQTPPGTLEVLTA